MPQSTYEKNLKLATKQAGLVFSTRVAGYLLGFISQAMFARLLGADEFGLYSLGLTIANVGVLFAVFGLNSGMTRFLGEYLGKKDFAKAKGTIIEGFKITFLLSILFAVIITSFRKWIAVDVLNEPRLIPIIPWFSIVLVLLAISRLMSGVFQGLKKPSVYFAFKEVFERLLRVGIFVLLYLLGIRLFGVVLATVVSLSLVFPFLVFYLYRYNHFVFDKSIPIEKDSKKLIRYSSNMLFVSFTYFLMGQVNRLILGAFLDSTSVGLYTIAGTVAGLSAFFLTSFNSIFASMIAELYHSDDLDTLNKMYSNLTRWIVTLTIPVTLWLIIFSEDILSVFGKDYLAAKYALILLAAGQFVNAAVGSCGLMLSMTKFQRYEMINGVIVAGLNLSLNILLIPKLGIIGSAIGGMIAISAVNILKSIEVFIVLKMQPYNRRFIKPVLSLVVTAFILIPFSRIIHFHYIFTLSLGLAISFTVFFGVLILLKPYPEDVMIFKSIIKRVKSHKKIRK